MAKYDGVGFRPMKTPREGAIEKVGLPPNSKSGKAKGGHFLCADHRTLAHFWCEPVDLSDGEYAQPFYRREISILEKLEAEPGIKADEILDKFTEFERNEIGPLLTPALLAVMLDALNDMNYIEIRDGKAYATGKEPPSRPKTG